jgi:hypothetical protein
VLLNKAQREFHDMFTRTYGIMYQKNAEVFQEYFKELKVYYDKGATNPALSTTTFFSTLYQKMFQVEKKGLDYFPKHGYFAVNSSYVKNLILKVVTNENIGGLE